MFHPSEAISTIPDAADRVICPCLGVTEGEVRGAISTGQVGNLQRVMECTGAGTGCTACRRRLAALLESSREQLAERAAKAVPTPLPGYSSPSPTCVVR
jgi:bacterioferritin-associated ferredoxin